jgi:hypothetical protein
MRLRSTVDGTEVVVVRAPTDEIEVGCGGNAMVELGQEAEPSVLDPECAGGTAIGKRYADDVTGVELLCTKSGEGTLTLNGLPLAIKGAKPLPSSD